jgi:hypothetical protein
MDFGGNAKAYKASSTPPLSHGREEEPLQILHIAIRSNPKRAVCVIHSYISLSPICMMEPYPPLEKHLAAIKRRFFKWTLHKPSEAYCP